VIQLGLIREKGKLGEGKRGNMAGLRGKGSGRSWGGRRRSVEREGVRE